MFLLLELGYERDVLREDFSDIGVVEMALTFRTHQRVSIHISIIDRRLELFEETLFTELVVAGSKRNELFFIFKLLAQTALA